MLDNEDLKIIIRQLIRHHELDKDQIINMFINVIDKEANGAETSSMDIYEDIIRILITGGE